MPDTLLSRELLLKTEAREIHKLSRAQGDDRTWTLIVAMTQEAVGQEEYSLQT